MNDSAPFTFDFALDSEAQIELEGKSLRIEGYAAGFDRDRENEAFERGVFDKGLEKYFKRNPILCYHHHTDQALGVVEEAKLDGKGLYVKARLDDPEPNTPLADVYNKVKSGTIKGFSVGGIFKRRMTPRGPMIHTADVAEISVTPVPMEPGSLFELAGKAFGTDSDLDAAVAALAEFSTALDVLEGKAYDGGYLRRERPTINTPGDVAKAVDRACGGVEEEEALREYLIREAEAKDCMVLIPDEWLLEGKAISAKKRANAKYTFDGTDKYPIDNCTDVKNAISRSGSSTEDQSKVRAYIQRVAKELGCSDLIPEDWLS